MPGQDGQASRSAPNYLGPSHRDHGPLTAAGRSPDGVGPHRELLRRATAAAHRTLEAQLEAAGCFDDRSGYVRYLLAVAPLYAALEGMLADAVVGRWLPDWPRRRKAGLIRADLRALGAGEPPAFPVRAAVAAALPPPWHAGVVFAVLYVLEGATLGGAVLSRRVAHFGLARGSGASFLDPYRADRGVMWRGYLHALEDAELAPSEEAELGSWAAATFALFTAWAPASQRTLLLATSPP